MGQYFRCKSLATRFCRGTYQWRRACLHFGDGLAFPMMFVTDLDNHRAMKWAPGTVEGEVVAGLQLPHGTPQDAERCVAIAGVGEG